MSEPGRLVARLRSQIDDALGPFLRSGESCALLDFPTYGNVGDSAIWLGTRKWLRERGVRVAYTASSKNYSPRRLAARLGEGAILLSGGGNLGDLWPDRQSFRERVIADFPGRRVVQLPQSVCFREPAALERARAVFDAHPDLTLLLRDERSLELASAAFDVPTSLCPDLALVLGALERPVPATDAILYLARTDHEGMAAGRAEPRRAAIVVDWAADPPPRHGGVRAAAVRRAPLGGSLLFDAVADQRLRRGCRTLSRGRVVVSDRLHAHVLSLLLGIPHVLVPDAFGKVRAFYETWTSSSPLAAWADSPAAALAAAKALAVTVASTGP